VVENVRAAIFALSVPNTYWVWTKVAGPSVADNHHAIRSKIVNSGVLFLGIMFLFAGGNLWLQGLQLYGSAFPSQNPAGMLEGLTFFALAFWCLRGAVKNLKAAGRALPTARSTGDRAIQVHLLALVVAACAYVLVGLAHWRWHWIGVAPVKVIHYTTVALFALIPVTLLVAVLMRRRSTEEPEAQH
jgi:hypothetical protein